MSDPLSPARELIQWGITEFHKPGNYHLVGPWWGFFTDKQKRLSRATKAIKPAIRIAIEHNVSPLPFQAIIHPSRRICREVFDEAFRALEILEALASKDAPATGTTSRDAKWAKEYQEALEAGEVSSKAEFARLKNVNRDTMSKALKRGGA
jgi:hypothetical protein